MIKKKCVECEEYYKLHKFIGHKTSYCKKGEKSVSITSGKSVACKSFKPANNFNIILEKNYV